MTAILRDCYSFVTEQQIIHFVVVFLIDWRADSFYAEVSVEECLGKRGDIEIEC